MTWPHLKAIACNFPRIIWDLCEENALTACINMYMCVCVYMSIVDTFSKRRFITIVMASRTDLWTLMSWSCWRYLCENISVLEKRNYRILYIGISYYFLQNWRRRPFQRAEFTQRAAYRRGGLTFVSDHAQIISAAHCDCCKSRQ